MVEGLDLSDSPQSLGCLDGVRVVELDGQRSEFCGRILSGAGADVIRVEPLQGSSTRSIGPFYQDVAGPERSLYFWHYNVGKRGITLDTMSTNGRRALMQLLETADVVIDGRSPKTVDKEGFAFEEVLKSNPRAVVCSITPFGLTGPYRDYAVTDLIHLALGGQMMSCGYDPPPGDYDHRQPSANYDTPPIAPQMWHAYHTAGVQAACAILAALFAREFTGEGEHIDCAVHDALAGCTEGAMTRYIYDKLPTFRQTGRHAGPAISVSTQIQAGDGNYALANLMGFGPTWGRFLALMRQEGLDDAISSDPRYENAAFRRTAEASTRVGEIMQAIVMTNSAEELMLKGQRAGLAWAAIRRPEDNLADPHWQARHVFARIEHPELGASFDYVAVPWLSDQMPWQVGKRAPLIGEHNDEILGGELGLTEEEIRAMSRGGRLRTDRADSGMDSHRFRLGDE